MIAKTDKHRPRMSFRLAVRSASHFFFYLRFAHRAASFTRMEGCVDCAARRATVEKQELCTSRGGSDLWSRLPRPSGALEEFMSASPIKAERL